MPRRFSLSTVAAVVGTFMVLGCGDGSDPTAPPGQDPLAPNLAVNNTGFFDRDFTIWDPCNGEFVDFVTKRKHVFNTTFDANGGIHIGFHRAWRGKGVGQVTGTEYPFNFPWQRQFYVRGPFPEVFHQSVNNNLVSKGSADNRLFTHTEQFTVNANGDVTVDIVHRNLRCVG
jgi:hypothetical protein